ncbi:MAG: glycosyltransferase family 4 protein, partial [Flavobacteriales bacterium]|nr:glycosyltransferase family 4 protein [Flavobacteriales bacterium]
GCIAINNISRGLLNQNQDLKIITISTVKHPFLSEKIESNFKNKTNIEHLFVDTKLNIVDAFSNLVTYDSYNISRFFSPDFDQLVIETLQSTNFDIVHLESLFTTPYLETIRNHSNAKIVLRSHNLEYMIWERLASETNNPAKKIYLNLLSNQLKNYEIDIISKIDGIAAISKEDEKKYLKLGCKSPLQTIPFGIDTKSYKSNNKNININHLSFFHLGAMNWKPNLEAVGWLNKDIWPTISSSFPEYKLHLAGKNMPQWIINNSSNNIINHQEVESAVDFMNEFDIMLVPLLSAGGIRVKIIEGMALGKVIISTRIGAEGIDYNDGVNLIIADTALEFRDKIKWLTDNPEKIKEIGDNAKNYISEKYDNTKISKKLVQFYKAL